MAKRERLTALGTLQAQDIEQLVGDAELSKLFGEMEKNLDKPELGTAVKFINGNIVVSGKRRSDMVVKPQALAKAERICQGNLDIPPKQKASLLGSRLFSKRQDYTLPALVQK